jgi:3-phosphoshikimate 1-carboxyvinyltransferase
VHRQQKTKETDGLLKAPSIVLGAPDRLCGVVNLPASKSISGRVLLIGALAGSRVAPHNVSECDDTYAMLDALEALPDVVDVGAAGTAMRFLTAYLASTVGTHTITGSERMLHRPIGVLVDALRSLGAHITYVGEEGFPPLRIEGTSLEGGQIEVDGSVSSQYVSALLMLGPTLRNGLTLQLTGGIVSRPYIDLTLGIMSSYGARARWTAADCIEVLPTGYRSDVAYDIENDWSAASYWYEMMALTDDAEAVVHLPGLRADSLQGDSAVSSIYEQLGVETVFEDGAALLRKMPGQDGRTWYGAGLDRVAMEYDFSGQPDLAQTVVVTCAMKGWKFRFGGLGTLKIKETDRLAALCTELGKLGIALREEPGGVLCWDGERHEADAAAIDTYDDHRMAMAFAPCCLRGGEIRINHPQVVTKSYPGYWDDLRKLGFNMHAL